jgi:orotidine-5'-phosphate decarboxylase
MIHHTTSTATTRESTFAGHRIPIMNAPPHLAAFSVPLNSKISLSDRLIVALDVETVQEAEKIVEDLGDLVTFYKIGLQLQYASGNRDTVSFIKSLVTQKKKVFLDSKIFDIANTIEKTVENIARMDVDFLTVHGDRKVVQAAVKVAREKLKIFAVTFLTTLDHQDLLDMNIPLTVEQFVSHRVVVALEAGADGVISSGLEASLVKRVAYERNSDLRVVTPGIRPAGSPPNDQRRVATPYDSIRAGADYLVVGRPILNAVDQQSAVKAIFADIQKGLAERPAMGIFHS